LVEREGGRESWRVPLRRGSEVCAIVKGGKIGRNEGESRQVRRGKKRERHTGMSPTMGCTKIESSSRLSRRVGEAKREENIVFWRWSEEEKDESELSSKCRSIQLLYALPTLDRAL
jgi:hypothetical protein